MFAVVCFGILGAAMQQINLYLEEFRPQKDNLNFRQLLMVTAAFLLVYIALGWHVTSNTTLLKQQVEQERKMLMPLEAQKAELDKMLASRPDDQRLELTLAALQADLQNKSLALNTLKNSDIDASGGYSTLLSQLAQNSNRRIWFTDIQIADDVLILKGQTVDPKLITSWIDNATTHKSLSRRFSGIAIAQNEKDSRVYDFELNNGVLVHHE